MAKFSNVIKAKEVLFDRIVGYMDDGYTIVNLATCDSLFFAKLKHQRNKKVIIIKGYPKENKFSQSTDNKLVIEDAPILCSQE